MKNLYFALIILSSLFVSSCASTKQSAETSSNWQSTAKMEDSEIFVDVTSIKRNESMMTAREKKIFFTPDSKEAYISKIRDKYETLGKAQKAAKWVDFSYTIYTAEYDCLNSRFRILSVEDFDSQDVRIIRTTPNKNRIEWLNVDKETVGDYTFFFVCDYEN